MTLPSPHYLQHYPTYFAPEPPPAPQSIPMPKLTSEPESVPSPLVKLAAAKVDANPLLGTWVRELDGVRLTVRFAEKRLYATVEESVEPAPAEDRSGKPRTLCLKVDADYGVGPDGRVFGVITGAEVSGSAAEDEAGLFVRVFLARPLEDLPFAFRIRVDGNDATLNGFRIAIPEGGGGFDDSNRRTMMLGKFRRHTGEPLPALKTGRGSLRACESNGFIL